MTYLYNYHIDITTSFMYSENGNHETLKNLLNIEKQFSCVEVTILNFFFELRAFRQNNFLVMFSRK